jgi:hypothetical protein
MTLDESCLADTAVTDEYELELWDLTVLLLIDHLKAKIRHWGLKLCRK